MDKIYFQLKLIDGTPYGTFANFPAFNRCTTKLSGHTRDLQYIDKLENHLRRSIAYVNQVHGTTIVEASKSGNQGEGDGLLLSGEVLGAVFTADCVPIVFSDQHGKFTAVVHAGWKGSLDGIALKTVELLKQQGAQKIYAAIFPSAQPCCYEVGYDLFEKFMVRWPRETLSIFRKHNQRIYLDLTLFHRLTLEEVGVDVFSSNICTICSREYYSYRRDKTAFRQITLAGRRDSTYLDRTFNKDS